MVYSNHPLIKKKKKTLVSGQARPKLKYKNANHTFRIVVLLFLQNLMVFDFLYSQQFPIFNYFGVLLSQKSIFIHVCLAAAMDVRP